MKNFIVIFREPDGRAINHAEEEIKIHQLNWSKWFGKWSKEGKLNGGSGLTLNGRVVKEYGTYIADEPHKNGTEIIGGYLLLNTRDMDEATDIIKDCPIYEFGGYAEIRELQNQE